MRSDRDVTFDDEVEPRNDLSWAHMATCRVRATWAERFDAAVAAQKGARAMSQSPLPARDLRDEVWVRVYVEMFAWKRCRGNDAATSAEHAGFEADFAVEHMPKPNHQLEER